MKVLCKKGYVFKDHEFNVGKYYDVVHSHYFNQNTNSVSRPVHYNPHILYHIETECHKKSAFWAVKDKEECYANNCFNEYFYSPEETKNMLRTELIEKMLDESIM